MAKLIGKYIARGDDGQTYQVHEYQEFIDAGTKDGDAVIPGMKYCTLGDGSKVNHIDARHWEIVATGTILTRVR
ncbi:MAG TPA: hypothetical protein VGB70_06000 [Allosphingosinicella sp.]|jgi:hypothetical protein